MITDPIFQRALARQADVTSQLFDLNDEHNELAIFLRVYARFQNAEEPRHAFSSARGAEAASESQREPLPTATLKEMMDRTYRSVFPGGAGLMPINFEEGHKALDELAAEPLDGDDDLAGQASVEAASVGMGTQIRPGAYFFLSEDVGHFELPETAKGEGARPVAADQPVAANTSPAPSSNEPAVTTLPPSEGEPKQASSEPIADQVTIGEATSEVAADGASPPPEPADETGQSEGGENVERQQEEVADAATSTPPISRSATLSDQVRAAFAENPMRSVRQVADDLGIYRGAVSGLSSKLKIKWLSHGEAKARAERKEPSVKKSAGKPAKEPVGEPPLAAVAPGEVVHAASPGVVVPFKPGPFGSPHVVHTKRQRESRKTMFRLTDGDGRYLHQSCMSMVVGTKNSWQGTQDQLLACRRKFLLAKDLKERVIEK